MRIYIFTLLLALLTSFSAYSQKLMIEIDVMGNFVTRIIINDNSSITLNQKGDIINVNVNACIDDNDSSLGLSSSGHNLNSGRISRIGGLDIEYDFHTKKISEIGDFEIDYDFHTKRISKIGNVDFDYDFHTKKVSEIGELSIEYDFHSKKMSEIGDILFSYHFPSRRLESIENKEFKYEFEDRNDALRASSNRVRFSYGGILFLLKIR